MAGRWSTRMSVNWRRSTLFKCWKQATQRRPPAASEVVARQSLQSVGTNNHCTWCHIKVVACSVPAGCDFFVLLRFSVLHFNWFEFNLPSLCKVDTPSSRYCRSSLLTLQGVVLIAIACPVVLWLWCGNCVNWIYRPTMKLHDTTAVGVTYYSSEIYLSTQNTNTQSHQTNWSKL